MRRRVMKACIKATGEIIEVSQGIYSPYQYVDDNGTIYTEEQLEILQKDSSVIFTDPTLDYWTRLEHQYAGMAMQGLVTRGEVLGSSVQEIARDIAEISCEVAHALVEKMKEERK